MEPSIKNKAHKNRVFKGGYNVMLMEKPKEL